MFSPGLFGHRYQAIPGALRPRVCFARPAVIAGALDHRVIVSMLRHALVTFCFMALTLCGCTGVRSTASSVDLTGNDDEAATARLQELLHDAGLPVEAATGPSSLFVYRRGMATLLSPVLQTEGLDRIIGTRSYAPATGRSNEDLADLAATLNERLNVASFKLADDTLLMEANLTFLDRLALAEMLAFLDWLDEIELAIRRVDADAQVLILTGS